MSMKKKVPEKVLPQYSKKEVREMADKNPHNIYISIDDKIYNMIDFLKKVFNYSFDFFNMNNDLLFKLIKQ